MDADLIEVIVEIPHGSRNKYELDRERGVLVLNRVLYSSVHYPTDYGFISGTLAQDGDALDALVVVDEPTFPGCHVFAGPIGVLNMRDEKGEDRKILAVPVGDPRFSSIRDLHDIDQHWLRDREFLPDVQGARRQVDRCRRVGGCGDRGERDPACASALCARPRTERFAVTPACDTVRNGIVQ